MVTHAPLTDADRARIAAAVAQAESMTGVELRLVLAHWSSHYGAFALIYAALFALIAGGIGAAIWPGADAGLFFIGQAILFAIALLVLQWPALRCALVPPPIKRKAAWRHARLHYASIGLKQPHTHSLVLVFCSAVERTVEILVDDAVHAQLPEAVWLPIVANFKAAFAQGRVADAYVAAAGACAAVLAPVFPTLPGQSNELPDDLVEL